VRIAVSVALVATVLARMPVLAQEQTEVEDAQASETMKLDFDFSDSYKTLSEDLEKTLRWKNLFKIFGVGDVHVFPSRESGPYLGPPLRIWGNGFGTSLWRDPVTGWALQ
jgi:hypothetical protein